MIKELKKRLVRFRLVPKDLDSLGEKSRWMWWLPTLFFSIFLILSLSPINVALLALSLLNPLSLSFTFVPIWPGWARGAGGCQCYGCEALSPHYCIPQEFLSHHTLHSADTLRLSPSSSSQRLRFVFSFEKGWSITWFPVYLLRQELFKLRDFTQPMLQGLNTCSKSWKHDQCNSGQLTFWWDLCSETWLTSLFKKQYLLETWYKSEPRMLSWWGGWVKMVLEKADGCLILGWPSCP